MKSCKFNKTTPIVRGLNRTRSALLEAIKLQTGILLTYEADNYFRKVDLWIRCNGLGPATKRLKEINHIALNHLLGQPNPEYWKIATRNGFPRDFYNLRKFRKTPEGKQAILGLLGYYRMLVTKGAPDLSSIIDEGPQLPLEMIQSIAKIDVDFHIDLSSLSPPKQLFRSKQGPNGQAMQGSLADAVALESTGLAGTLEEYCEHFDTYDVDLYGDLDELLPVINRDQIHNPKTSKLSIKREGGGKTRIFAMVDYWTQCALAPLHEELAKILRTIPRDCTFNQGKGIPEIKRWTKVSSENYSFDLSSATDRFPIELQIEILSRLTGNLNFAKTWAKLMVDRDFSYAGKTYRWKVGQPLGAYSSWPMFALSHHYVVLWCSQQLGITDPKYHLLGDDIVIQGKDLAELYYQTINKLGVKINLAKTLRGKPIEFAKRIFHEGYEISPTPVRMIDSLLKDDFMIREAVNHLLERSPYPKASALRLTYFINSMSRIMRTKEIKLEVLVFAPFGAGALASLSGINPEGDAIWPVSYLSSFEVERLETAVRCKILKDKYKILQSKIDREVDYAKKHLLTGLSSDHSYLHPINASVLEVQEKFSAKQNAFSEYFRQINYTMVRTGLDQPNLSVTSFEGLSPSFKYRQKVQAESLIMAYNVCMQTSEYIARNGEQPPYLRPNKLRRIIDLSSAMPFRQYL